MRRTRSGEFVPTLAAEIPGGNSPLAKQLQRQRVRRQPGVTSGTECPEPARAKFAEQTLSQNAARRIAGAQKQNIEWSTFRHCINLR
jgi:hypothetical protein